MRGNQCPDRAPSINYTMKKMFLKNPVSKAISILDFLYPTFPIILFLIDSPIVSPIFILIRILMDTAIHTGESIRL